MKKKKKNSDTSTRLSSLRAYGLCLAAERIPIRLTTLLIFCLAADRSLILFVWQILGRECLGKHRDPRSYDRWYTASHVHFDTAVYQDENVTNAIGYTTPYVNTRTVCV